MFQKFRALFRQGRTEFFFIASLSPSGWGRRSASFCPNGKVRAARLYYIRHSRGSPRQYAAPLPALDEEILSARGGEREEAKRGGKETAANGKLRRGRNGCARRRLAVPSRTFAESALVPVYDTEMLDVDSKKIDKHPAFADEK